MEKGSSQSNLDCFLNSTTPVVPSQILPKGEIMKLNSLWHPWERDNVEFFTLSDLWNCYDEWSAYGAEVPISLDNGDNVVQYYVPYLSAIQIFTSNLSLNSLRYSDIGGRNTMQYEDTTSAIEAAAESAKKAIAAARAAA